MKIYVLMMERGNDGYRPVGTYTSQEKTNDKKNELKSKEDRLYPVSFYTEVFDVDDADEDEVVLVKAWPSGV